MSSIAKEISMSGNTTDFFQYRLSLQGFSLDIPESWEME